MVCGMSTYRVCRILTVVSTPASTRIDMIFRLCICTCVYISIYMCVCVCARMYTHTHTLTGHAKGSLTQSYPGCF
jgi:hypothetical protein